MRNRVEVAASRQIPNTREGISPLTPAVAEQPMACAVAMAAFVAAYYIAKAFGPSEEAEAALAGTAGNAAEMPAGMLIDARHEAVQA